MLHGEVWEYNVMLKINQRAPICVESSDVHFCKLLHWWLQGRGLNPWVCSLSEACDATVMPIVIIHVDVPTPCKMVPPKVGPPSSYIPWAFFRLCNVSFPYPTSPALGHKALEFKPPILSLTAVHLNFPHPIMGLVSVKRCYTIKFTPKLKIQTTSNPASYLLMGWYPSWSFTLVVQRVGDPCDGWSKKSPWPGSAPCQSNLVSPSLQELYLAWCPPEPRDSYLMSIEQGLLAFSTEQPKMK